MCTIIMSMILKGKIRFWSHDSILQCSINLLFQKSPNDIKRSGQAKQNLNQEKINMPILIPAMQKLMDIEL